MDVIRLDRNAVITQNWVLTKHFFSGIRVFVFNNTVAREVVKQRYMGSVIRGIVGRGATRNRATNNFRIQRRWEGGRNSR